MHVYNTSVIIQWYGYTYLLYQCVHLVQFFYQTLIKHNCEFEVDACYPPYLVLEALETRAVWIRIDGILISNWAWQQVVIVGLMGITIDTDFIC